MSVPTQSLLPLQTSLSQNRAVTESTLDDVHLIPSAGDRPPLDGGEIKILEAQIIYSANLVRYESKWFERDQLSTFQRIYSRNGSSVHRINFRIAIYQLWIINNGFVDRLERQLVSAEYS